MNAHETAESLVTQFRDRELNEADTRHQLIDPVLHDVLGWPRNRTRCELNAHPGFADYLLTRQDGTPALIIEAKREGIYFLGRSRISLDTILGESNPAKGVSECEEETLVRMTLSAAAGRRRRRRKRSCAC